MNDKLNFLTEYRLIKTEDSITEFNADSQTDHLDEIDQIQSIDEA